MLGVRGSKGEGRVSAKFSRGISGANVAGYRWKRLRLAEVTEMTDKVIFYEILRYRLDKARVTFLINHGEVVFDRSKKAHTLRPRYTI